MPSCGIGQGNEMDLEQGNIKKIFFRYLAAAFGSACILCVYGIVDMAVIGQYYGPDGTAAMSVVMPFFNIIYGLGLLVGIGGSVLYGAERGRNGGTQNEYFTVGLIEAVFFSLIVWVVLIFFDEPLLYFFGADESLFPLAEEYMVSIRVAAPVFLFSQFFGAFLRNDGAPGLATAAVIISGVFNVFGDIWFVFVMDMGIVGAGIATCMGSGVSVCIMLTHFLSKRNTLALVRVHAFWKKSAEIVVSGFATFFTDLALGIITVFFNRQIMSCMGSAALAVFGILMNINTFVQCCGYSVGQASQPIFSVNYGAGRNGRVRELLILAGGTAVAFGGVWLVLILCVPNAFVRLFMSPTDEVLSIAPSIMRVYGIAFLFVPFNVFSTYYFQSVMRPRMSFAVSLLRGLLLSGTLIMLLPVMFSADALWWAMPLAEGFTAVAAIAMIWLSRPKGAPGPSDAL